MSRDPAAGRLAPLAPLLLLLSGVGALRPDELFPYGESRGDRLLPEGDDESSAAVKLAVPLHFYDSQFTNLYVSSALGVRGWARVLEVFPSVSWSGSAVGPLGTRLCGSAAAS